MLTFGNWLDDEEEFKLLLLIDDELIELLLNWLLGEKLLLLLRFMVGDTCGTPEIDELTEPSLLAMSFNTAS